MKPRSTCVLTLFLLGACGGDDGVARPDADTVTDTTADVPDGGDVPVDVPSEAIARLDWTTQRGAPLSSVTTTHDERELVAVHADGVVSGHGCEAEVGCDYTWHDAAGAVVATLADRYPIYSAIASPAGTQLSLVQRDSYEDCGPGPERPTVIAGRHELIDVARGEAAWSAPVRTNVFFDPAFMPSGDWFRLDPIAGAECQSTLTTWRSTTAPYAESPLDEPDFYAVGELPDGRWYGWRGEPFGVVAPDGTGAFVSLGDRVDDFAIGGGWLHAFDGYGDTTEHVRAISPAPESAVHVVNLPATETWRGKLAWGRWVYVATAREADALRLGVVDDVLGQYGPHEVQVRADLSRPLAFIGGGSAALLQTRVDGDEVVERLELTTAVRTIVARGTGAIHVLGDGDAALWQGADGVMLIEAQRVEPIVTGPVTQVVTMSGVPNGAPLPAGGPGGRAEPRQRWIATIVTTDDLGHHHLSLFDLATRRLVILTERLYFAPVQEAPLLADTCGQPWTLRNMGSARDGYLQDARWFFFVEAVDAGDAPLWVMPIDLSAPPRQFTAMHPTYCHPPRASPDGTRLAIDVNHYDGTSSHLTIAQP